MYYSCFLKISENFIRDEGCEYISKFIKNQKSLTSLNLKSKKLIFIYKISIRE